jgi:hypothetical protein
MIDFAVQAANAATTTFTIKDLIQFIGLFVSLGSIVWFLARRLGSIDATLATMAEQQKNNAAQNARIETKVDANTHDIADLRERLAKMEARQE